MNFSAFYGLPSPYTKENVKSNHQKSAKSNHQKDNLTSRDSLLKLIFSQSKGDAAGLLNCLTLISDSKSDDILTGRTSVLYN